MQKINNKLTMCETDCEHLNIFQPYFKCQLAFHIPLKYMQLVVMLIIYQLNDKVDYFMMIRGFEINAWYQFSVYSFKCSVITIPLLFEILPFKIYTVHQSFICSDWYTFHSYIKQFQSPRKLHFINLRLPSPQENKNSNCYISKNSLMLLFSTIIFHSIPLTV